MKTILIAALMFASLPLLAGTEDEKNGSDQQFTGLEEQKKIVVPLPQKQTPAVDQRTLVALAKTAAAVYETLGRPSWPWQQHWYCVPIKVGENGITGMSFASGAPAWPSYCIKPSGKVRNGNFELESLELKLQVDSLANQYRVTALEFGRALVKAGGGIEYLGPKFYYNTWNARLPPEPDVVGVELAYWAKFTP